MTKIVSSIDYEEIVSRIQSVYQSCSTTEQMQLLQILREVSDKGYSYTLEKLWLADFKEVPVSIDEFICNPIYLGTTNRNGEAVYPFWRETVSDIFSKGNQYNEIILSGATRIGKTSTATIISAYMLYKLMLYRDPWKYFKKKEASRFTLVYANLNEKLAKGVAYREFNDTLKESEWFCQHGTFSSSKRNFYYIPDNEKIDIIPISDPSQALGMQVWCSTNDEVNFAKAGVKDIRIAKAHMKKLYDTINARISGTFRIKGEVYGKMITCSSKNTDSDFLSGHIETQLNSGNTHLYLVDKPQWDVLPPEMFSNKKFYFTIGDRYKKGFVVPEENEDEMHLKDYEAQGYKVMSAPLEMKSSFIADYDIALRDLAGVSVIGALGFITQEIVTPCISQERHNPFFTDEIVVGKRDNHSIEEYFHLASVPQELKDCIMNIHLDLSETGDRTGIGGTCVCGQKIVEDMSGKKVSLPYFKEVFSVGVKNPPNDRLSFQKVVNFMEWLRNSGFNIGVISADQYQSSYLLEVLELRGFQTKKISVDRSPDPYIGLKHLLHDQRIELIKNELRETELVRLEQTNGKIDHPADGSKDLSDCLAGATWTLTIDHVEDQPSNASVIGAISAVNQPNRSPGSSLPIFNNSFTVLR